ncbi:MAG: hypothetical protein CME41_00015 [Haliea sp.]|nr:hypothetical protein [Haliea sp.]
MRGRLLIKDRIPDLTHILMWLAAGLIAGIQCRGIVQESLLAILVWRLLPQAMERIVEVSEEQSVFH